MKNLPRMLLGLWIGLASAGSLPAMQGRMHTNAGTSHVNFNFDRVDLRLLVKLVGDLTGKAFILDDAVQGTVTVVSGPKIPIDEVYPLFLSILETSGHSVVRRGEVWAVIPLPERLVPAAPLLLDKDSAILREGLVTKVFRLEHISAVELRALVEPMVRGGKTGAVAAFGATNHLVVTDEARNVLRIEALIADLDRAGAARQIEIMELRHADAEEVARQLNTALGGAESSAARVGQHMRRVAEGLGSLPAETLVATAGHANSLVLVGTEQRLRELVQLIERIDQPAAPGMGPLNAIFLKYLSAEQAAQSLNALLEKSTAREQARRVAIEPSVANNALIVHSSAQDFEWLRALVDQLDVVPQQVLVEILIAEVSANKGLDLGVEWSTIDAPASGQTTVIGRSRPGDNDLVESVSAGLFPQGLSLGLARGFYTDESGRPVPRIPVLLRALAEERDVKILSSIPLWAQNNSEASVDVVENRPVLRSTIEGGTGTARDIIQNIDRLDVGIKLKLTPHISPDNQILLHLNPSIEAIIDEGPPDQPFTPVIARREVNTTVTVPNRATVMISGLIRDDKVTTVSKVPLLGDLPLLGGLFRRKADRIERTNLLIFVTPTIVTDIQEALRMKSDWEERTGLSEKSEAFAPRMSPDGKP